MRTVACTGASLGERYCVDRGARIAGRLGVDPIEAQLRVERVLRSVAEVVVARAEEPDGAPAPTGLPDEDAPEAEPLGAPGETDEPDRQDERMPGIPTEGEPPTSG